MITLIDTLIYWLRDSLRKVFFIQQTFWQLTATFFSGIVAHSVCRLNVWEVTAGDSLRWKKLIIITCPTSSCRQTHGQPPSQSNISTLYHQWVLVPTHHPWVGAMALATNWLTHILLPTLEPLGIALIVDLLIPSYAPRLANPHSIFLTWYVDFQSPAARLANYYALVWMIDVTEHTFVVIALRHLWGTWSTYIPLKLR